MHISIVALGPSYRQYIELVERLGGRHNYCDQTWVVNTFGDVLACDLVFHMDDVRVQEIRAKAAPDGKIAGMLKWLRKHPGPIMTSRPHPDYPGLVAFPLEEVINRFGSAYFNSTVAYAVAYALFVGAKELSLFGIDFTWPNAHEAERGRACVEYWLGRAHQMGVMLHVADSSTLMDAREGRKLYGYDTLDVEIGIEDGRAQVVFAEKEPPTAEEIEARYDHSKHPASAVMGV